MTRCSRVSCAQSHHTLPAFLNLNGSIWGQPDHVTEFFSNLLKIWYVKMFKIFKNDFEILEVVTWKTRIDSARKFTVGNVRNLAVENQISSGEGIFCDLITKSQPSYHITKSKFDSVASNFTKPNLETVKNLQSFFVPNSTKNFNRSLRFGKKMTFLSAQHWSTFTKCFSVLEIWKFRVQS